METKIFKSINLIRRGSGANLNLFRYAAMVAMLLMLGAGNAWAGHGGKCTAKLQVNTGTGSGSVYAATTNSATSGSSSVSADCGNSDSGTHTHTFYAFATPADGYTFLGWTESATSTDNADASNPKAVTITSDSHGTVTKTLYAHFVEKAKVNITFEAPANGTYTIAVNGGSAETVSSADVVKNNVEGVVLTATPASGYVFAGWYKLNSAGEFVEDLSIASPYNASFTTSETIKMGARFVPTTLGKFILKGSSTEYYGLKAATVAAGGSGTIVPVADETLVDGSDLMPFDNGTYSIKAGATLLVPYSSANTVQTAPVKINTTASATAISPYRKLILSDGVNIDCDGTICVGGQADAGNGGNPSGYVTGACGVIDMSKGGHIEMNNKAILYCWGFIKGQDMDQGNNTVDAGTITANSGSIIWEDFSVGDWRGGTATSNFSGRFFPFQSYYIQNIEVPVTYKYGSTLKNFFTFNMSNSAQETTFDVIGSNTALFKLTDAQSLVRKWYDPTTDLVCYEVSGTAVLDYISLTVYISINSYDYDLPISSNMHIILTKCNLTLNRPMLVQPGGIIEIKNDANVTLATNIYLYDKDEWGPWISGKYYRSYGDAYPILTSHKNRGNGSSNADLDDATFLVDGTLTISSGGLFSSAGGANVMGNGGGKVVFSSSLPSATSVKWYKGTNTSGDGEVGTTAMKAVNLCNEDGSYTKSIASTTFHNVNGRWFTASAKNEKADHTYDFTYISSGEVSGTGGTSSTTDAVYSNDKTGMEARMKWANVTADACADWWHGQGDQAGWFYNWTMNNAWHQFQSTETEGLYSGSNNKIYTKTDCNWEELGETDVNCLYTIDGKKKALVDGHFIELEPNSDDAAFHEAADPTKYYICFEGCNWHAATKYEGEKKAYVVDETTFIWYEERWMAVEREEPFFYTKDETNVTIYYEYIGSEWVLAQPYVEVTDAIETRQLLRFNEAITVASAKKNVTIKLLRDLVNITTPMTFTAQNTTCTLDLNGHVAEVQVVGAGTSEIKMLTLNGASTTFTITDNTTDKKGELKLIASVNTETSTKRWSGIYVQNGTLILQSGKVYVEHPFAWVTNSNSGFISGILVASAKTFTMNGGTLEVVSDYNTYGINAASGTPTVNINHGTIECIATKKDSPYGIIGYGTINISGDCYIHANAKANSSAKAVYANVSSSAKGTINISGGRLYAESTSSACGVHCAGTAVVTGDYNATTPNNTPKARYYAVVNITGGEITAVCRTSTTSYGVLSYGTTTISGGTITSTVQKSNQNTAYGVCTIGGTTTISGGANITANAPTTAYGVTATAANGDSNRGWSHVGVVNITGGTITANTTNTTTAYGLLVTGATWTINKTNSYSVFNGDYAAAGTATVTGGTFNANAKTTLARGIAVAATKTKNDASATPTCTINGGYYKTTGTGDVLGCNASALAADFHINGGYYSHDGNLATYTPSPKHVLTLASGDANRPPYYYKVAEAYQVTFKTEDGTANIIDPVYQEVGTAPVCSTEPTKESTSTNSFTFDGWATEANGAKVYEPNGLPNVTSAGATYYAHFATTTLKYRVHFDAATNGGECATENIYVNPGTAVGTLPTATKYGYTFNGWFTAASGGTQLAATTVISADADYYAQFTANSHTLTWYLDGGTVSTAGKIGSTTWPAKNATGTQSRSVAYGTILTTIPVVTKTGYTFNRWDPVPTSSMPNEDVTYTALWNPETNTKYYVKHYQQNIDDDNYTLVETDELTGTTDATVTPDRKSYDGFLTPTPQQLTIGAAGTSELVYNYDRVVYTINWNASANGGACATASTDVRHGATIALPAATKAGHILDGWYTKAEGGNKISEGATILQNYGTLYAQFVPTYTIIWNDENGNELSREEKLIGESLTPPDYNEEDTPEWDYTFHGWNDGTTTYAANAIPAVSGAATYTADISKVKNNYTLTIGVVEASYGSVNETSVTVPYGTSVSTSGNVLTIGTTTVTATPTAADAQYTYTFDDWNNVPATVTGNVTNIQAVFTRTTRTYTVTWKNGDVTLETDENVAYGTTPTYNGATPTKAADEDYTYTFNSWTPDVSSVTGNATYTATYTSTANVASVTAGGNTTYYTTLPAAFTAAKAKTNPTIKLLQDVSMGATTLTYDGANTCTLNLNGHEISGTARILFKVDNASAVFTVTDLTESKLGKLSLSTEPTDKAGYCANLVKGTLKLEAGTFYIRSTSTSQNAVGARVDGGEFIMNGGTVHTVVTVNTRVGHGVQPLGTANAIVNGGTVRVESAGQGYGMYVTGTMTVNGGKFHITAASTAEVVHHDADDPTKLFINGGYYNINTNMAACVPSSYHVLPASLTEDELTYNYKVAEAYTVTFNNYDGTQLQTGYIEKNVLPTYDGTPTKPSDAQYDYIFTGWDPAIEAVTANATYTATFNDHTIRSYQVRWENIDGSEIRTDQKDYGAQPSYEGTPTYSDGTGKLYVFRAWKRQSTDDEYASGDVFPYVGGPETYIAQYDVINNLDVANEQTISVNATVSTTTVRVEGKLNIASDKTLTTQSLVLKGTPNSSGEIIGNISATEHAYFHFSQEGGFKAKTWYAVAVPWAVDAETGISINDNVKTLGRDFDLIYYDGFRRSQGYSKTWNYVEDDADKTMLPGRAYMIYLAADAPAIRFERTEDELLNTAVSVKEYYSAQGQLANWNGIANPALYHAYVNAGAKDAHYGSHYGQVYDAETKAYTGVNMANTKLVVGQPIFVQAVEAKDFDVNRTAYAAPRRVQAAEEQLPYEVLFTSDNTDKSDKIILCTTDEKEANEYVVGQDLMKMGVSSVVPQIWIDRYNSRLCINTVEPINNTAKYPLSLFAPQAGEYTISSQTSDISSQTSDMLYLTCDGHIIWNLTYADYTVSLEKGTNARYGLTLVRNNAPEVATDIDGAVVDAHGETRKVLINEQVFIIRGENVYSIDGQMVK